MDRSRSASHARSDSGPRLRQDSYERAHLQALVTNMFVPKKKLKKKKAQTLVERVDTLLVE